MTTLPSSPLSSYPVSDLPEFSLNSSVLILSMIAGSVGRFLDVGSYTGVSQAELDLWSRANTDTPT